MTDEEIRELLSKASKGPYTARANPIRCCDEWPAILIDDAEGLGVAVVDEASPDAPNPRLLAAAPDLAAEVLRLQAENAELTAERDRLTADAARLLTLAVDLEKSNSELRDKNARLTRILAVERGDASAAPEGWGRDRWSWRKGNIEVARVGGGNEWGITDHSRARTSYDGARYTSALLALEAADNAAKEAK